MNDAPLTRARAIEILTEAEAAIRDLGVDRLALFGSVVRDDAGPDSDVDVLVAFAPGAKSFRNFMAVADLLEHRFGRRVEIVTYESLSPILAPHILAEAEDVVGAA